MTKSSFAVRAIAAAAVLQMTIVPVALANSSALVTQDPAPSSVDGVVRDSQGAPLAGARITIAGIGTGRSRTVRADQNGGFSATGLPAGVYTITVTAAGFGSARYEGMQLIAGALAQLEVELMPRGR